jgi:predicted DNA-binding transcriptional regulator
MEDRRGLLAEGTLVKSWVDSLYTDTVPPRRPPRRRL